MLFCKSCLLMKNVNKIYFYSINFGGNKVKKLIFKFILQLLQEVNSIQKI